MIVNRLAPALIAIAALAAALATSSPVVASSGQCTFTGPKYTVAGKTGTLYNLSVQNVSCAFATPWARKLAGTANVKPFYAVHGGPAGWNCNAQAAGKTITSGACVKGTKRFGWFAAV